MNILALESSAAACSAALCRDGVPAAQTFQCSGLTHSRTLLPMVHDMLKNCGEMLGRVDIIAVAAGPGSFTGLRIGVATAKGLAWAGGQQCAPCSTLESMAWPLAHMEGKLIVCAMDARRQQIYNAAFHGGGGELKRLREDRAISLEEAAGDLGALDGPMYIVGDGAELCRDFFTREGISCELAPGQLRLQSAVGAAMAAWRRWPEGCVSAQELVPTYLRLSQAERERLARGQS